MEYSAPPAIGMQHGEETARMRGAVPFPGKMAGGSVALPHWMRGALQGGTMTPGESISPATSTGFPAAPAEAHGAEETAPPRMRGAVGEGSAALPPWLRGAVPLPGKMSEESDLPAVPPAAPPAEKRATMSEAFEAIDDMAARLKIPAGARERAKEVFRKMDERKGKGHHHYYGGGKGGGGRSVDNMYAACLYVACRSEGAPRTFKELAVATRDGAASRKDIGKLITLIRKRLGDEAGGQAMDIGVVRAADYMERFGASLGMEEPEVRAAQEAARRLHERLDVRRNPDSTAAAIMYLAINRRNKNAKSFREVSIASGVAEGTIKQAYRELCPHADLLFA